MSLIYEALQRAESESKSGDASDSSTATELLQRVEKRKRTQHSAQPAEALSTLPTESSGTAKLLHGLMTSPPVNDLTSTAAPTTGELKLESFEMLHLARPYHPRLVALATAENSASEAFRLLSVRLRHMRRERSLKKLLICSTITQEGKSLISANLGCTIASDQKQTVLLVEGDMRRPSLSQLFGLGERAGLCDYLAGERTVAESVYRLEEANLWLMPAGTSHDNQNNLIQSDNLSEMIQQLGHLFQWIIIDSPPVLPLADASVWQRMVDGVLLVARNSTTQKGKLMRGLEALDTEKLVGAILNSATSTTEHDYYYYRDTSESPSALAG